MSNTAGYVPISVVKGANCSSELACAIAAQGTAHTGTNAQPAGTYFVVVDGSNGTSGSFDLKLTATGS